MLAVFGHVWPLFFREKSRNFCGQILPALAHVNIGVAPPEAPYATYGTHFSVQDFLLVSGEEKEKRGREHMPRKLNQTVRERLYWQKEEGRKVHRQLGAVEVCGRRKHRILAATSTVLLSTHHT